MMLATLASLAILAMPELARAAKHHVIVLANGDRITGEVEVLERGRLQFSTDDAGTMSIEWPKLRELTAAPEQFEVETTAGRRFVSSLGPGAGAGELRVVAPGDTASIPFGSIVRITTLNTFWGRIDGSLDWGELPIKQPPAINVSRNAAIARVLRHPVEPGLRIHPADGENDTRASVSLSGTRFSGRRWLVQGCSGSRNDELGLNARARGGGTPPRSPARPSAVSSSARRDV
jgi:hypothetical protein